MFGNLNIHTRLLMETIVFKNALIINEGKRITQDLLVKNGRIEKIASEISVNERTQEINAEGKYLVPGVIDDQVHFREPGLTHKAEIATESRAAVAGGVTSFMEMPNVKPATLTQALLQEKYDIAARTSPANYSFYMGVSNDNIDQVLRTNSRDVCGIKVFMGSSTGGMLVDQPKTLDALFANAPCLIATHCEDEPTVTANTKKAIAVFGEDIPPYMHPIIRDTEACYKSSSMAVELAKKHNTRLHILHITSAEEVALFSTEPLESKRITAEACVHHLTYTDADYATLGNLIKCNPAIKTQSDRDAVWAGLLNGNIDVIATDHAPHTWEEKQNKYANSPSGLPLVQHTLLMMLDAVKEGRFSLEKMVQLMSHNVATCYNIEERGFIREGYWADLVLVNPNESYTVTKENLLYKCGWSTLENKKFHHTIEATIVSGALVWWKNQLMDKLAGERLLFNR